MFSTELGGLELDPVGKVLANTVASTYPVASASASVVYTFNPSTETFERQTGVLGPIIGERAQTIGRGQFNAGISYSHVKFANINGTDLGELVNRPSIDNRIVSFPVVGGLTLADGRVTNFLPVQVQANLDVSAEIVTPSLTYGITPDFDVNLTVPVIVTSLDVHADVVVPDPRWPQFQLPPNDPNAQQRHVSASEDSTGVGDLLLRMKYVLRRGAPADLALGLGVSFPSGDVDNFHGTGDYRVQPSVILSQVFLDRVEPLLNAGVDINADDVDRSAFRWAAGATTTLYGPLNGALVFLGYHEFDEQTEPLETPFFLQIKRNDTYDASVGLRLLFWDTGVVSANAIIPLNNDGLRPEVIPTVQVEYGFSGWGG